MHDRQRKRSRRLRTGLLWVGAAAMMAGCSSSPVLAPSPAARVLRLPAELRTRREDRQLRKAVEADSFPRANEHGL